MPHVGDTLTKRFSVTDATGQLLPGVAFTTVQGIDPSGGNFTPNPPTDLGGGLYEVTVDGQYTAMPGQYYVTASITSPSPQHFEFNWLVNPEGVAERWKPGDTLMERFTMLDALSQPVDNGEFSIHTRGPDGSAFPLSPPVCLGNGVYQITHKLPLYAPTGSYYARLITTNQTPQQVFEAEWQVGRGPEFSGGHSLRTIRRMVMARFGDIVTAIATANGTDITLIDEDNLYGEPGRFSGREILFLSGANAGQQRYITGSSRNDSSVTLNRPLPFPTTEGDEADITNAYGLGVTFRAVRDAINYAIAVARQYHLAPMTYRPGQNFIRDDGVIPVPQPMVGVERVEMVDDCGDARPVRRAHSAGGNGWSLDHGTHSVVIRGHEARKADGWHPVIYGYTLPHDLTQDDDTTTIDIEWLVDMATSHICLDTLLSRQATGDWGSKGMLYKQNAERTLSRLTPILRSTFTRFQ